MLSPHGGKLINRIAEGKVKGNLKRKLKKFYKIKISRECEQELFNIATGVFSPLEGFLNRKDLISVLNEKRLTGGIAWTIPIVLDIPSFAYSELRHRNNASLVNDEGVVLAVMDIEDIYKYDKENFVKKVYGTSDPAHPGVNKVLNMGGYLVGGKIALINMPEHEFKEYTFTPQQTREKFTSLGWKTVVAFQTRNVPHIGHEYVQKTALSYVDGLFINPVIGKKKKGDFKDSIIIQSLQAMIKNYYPKDRVVMSVLQMEMRYAGPREAIHHAIIRKNFGCTHIIIGRDHAGVGNFYHPFAAHKIFDEFSDLGIQPIFFKSFFWCNRCGGVANDKTCPHDKKYIEDFSGTKMRQLLVEGKVPSGKLMRSEVAQCILRHRKPFVE